MRGQRTRTPHKPRSPSPWNGSQNPIAFCGAPTRDDMPGMTARGRERTSSFDGAKVSEQAQFRATGRRKTSVARVILRPGEGKVVVNRRPFEHYFHSEALRQEVQQPLVATETAGKFDLLVNAQGGGIHGQAGAVRLGIARALVIFNPELRSKLRQGGFLTRDPRAKERKKYGQKGARKRFQEAAKFVSDLAQEGKTVLFVGTKRQAQEAIAEEAARCQMYYVNHRWLGGLLTNNATIQKSIQRLKELEEMSKDGRYELLTKKEVQKLERERKHLEQNLVGIKEMPSLPDALFAVDSNKEDIAVKEARKLGIPVVAIVDTNCDPDLVDYVIPGNDDALRSIRLFTSRVADSVLEGRQAALNKQLEAEKMAFEQQAAELERQREAAAIGSEDEKAGAAAGGGV